MSTANLQKIANDRYATRLANMTNDELIRYADTTSGLTILEMELLARLTVAVTVPLRR